MFHQYHTNHWSATTDMKIDTVILIIVTFSPMEIVREQEKSTILQVSFTEIASKFFVSEIILETHHGD